MVMRKKLVASKILSGADYNHYSLMEHELVGHVHSLMEKKVDPTSNRLIEFGSTLSASDRSWESRSSGTTCFAFLGHSWTMRHAHRC